MPKRSVEGEIDLRWTSYLADAWADGSPVKDETDSEPDSTGAMTTKPTMSTDDTTQSDNQQTECESETDTITDDNGETIAGTSYDDYHSERTAALPASVDGDELTDSERRIVERAAMMKDSTQTAIAESLDITGARVSQVLKDHYPEHPSRQGPNALTERGTIYDHDDGDCGMQSEQQIDVNTDSDDSDTDSDTDTLRDTIDDIAQTAYRQGYVTENDELKQFCRVVIAIADDVRSDDDDDDETLFDAAEYFDGDRL